MEKHDLTIVDHFWKNVEDAGDNILARYWSEDTWQDMSWKAYGEAVNSICSGLLELGVEEGDTVGIMCSTRLEWGMIDLAILSLGGITGCIYPTLLGKDTAFILNDLKARVVFVESRNQLEEVLANRSSAPQLEHIVLIDGETCDGAISLSDLSHSGENHLDRYRKILIDRIRCLKQADPATVVYTSGTTGRPKGALHDHRSIIYTVENNVYPFEPGMVDLSYLPMAHVFERFGGFFGIIRRGDITIGYFRGDMQGLIQDFQELEPNMNRTAPRLLEKIYSAVRMIVASKSEDEQRAFEQALFLAKAVRVEEALYGRLVSPETQEQFEGAMLFEPFAKIHEMLGGRMDFFYGGGASIPREVTEFFFAIGIPVYELYGTSETIGTVTNYPGRTRPGTIGVPFPMVDWTGEPGRTRLAVDGEIENKGPNVLLEYLNRPEATADAFTADGWYRTGDLGEMDADGFIRITGRKKDIIVTSGGKNIAPQKIEDIIKESGYFSQVLVYGDNRKYLVALLVLDPTVIPTLAMKLGVDISGLSDDSAIYAAVARDSKTQDFIRSVVDDKNQLLFKQEQIVRFKLLDRDLKLELDEVTPTLKLKKNIVIGKFQDDLDRLYE